jgi:hypothetical protein
MNETDQLKLIERRNQLVEKIGKLKGAIRGTLVKTKKKCGKKTCQCEQGQLHPHMYVSIHRKPRNKVVYIRSREIEDTQIGIQAYRQVLHILDELSLINIELIKSQWPMTRNLTDKNKQQKGATQGKGLASR